MLTRGQEGSAATYEAYGKAVEILGKNSDPNSALCEVYELVQDLPTTSRIPPVLQCMIRLSPSTINDDASKAIQRLLISISNLDNEKAREGRSSTYTDDVFHFLVLTVQLSSTLIERNNKSLLKIFDNALNHLLFLVNDKKTDRFHDCCTSLTILMRQIGVANTNGKILNSIICLVQPDAFEFKPNEVYFANLPTKTLRNCAIFALWSLNSYLMNNVKKGEDFQVPLPRFVDALKFTYATNNSALQKVCTDQLATLLKLGGVEARKMFPVICQQLDFSYDHPVVVHAFNAVLQCC